MSGARVCVVRGGRAGSGEGAGAHLVSPIYLVSPVDDSPPDEPPFVYGAALFFRCSREDCRRSMPGLEDIAGARGRRRTRRR